jgi:hypothetical protein
VLRRLPAYATRSIVVVPGTSHCQLDAGFLAELLLECSPTGSSGDGGDAHPHRGAVEYVHGLLWTMDMYLTGRG